ncbi:hypothetical protein HaLaN_27549 [Haematococcus lacustris]|uniref:Uncharacterized protein n=1 Tax=Haematococcus lacustris TaxID=44745 RepID=A0A6A0A8E7_HAELA|nr:hypothetical protein HaLaN_27549 [Haematococcus lacustris]
MRSAQGAAPPAIYIKKTKGGKMTNVLGIACDAACDHAKLFHRIVHRGNRAPVTVRGQRVYSRCFVLNGLACPSTDSPVKQRPQTPAEYSPGPI